MTYSNHNANSMTQDSNQSKQRLHCDLKWGFPVPPLIGPEKLNEDSAAAASTWQVLRYKRQYQNVWVADKMYSTRVVAKKIHPKHPQT